MFSLETLQFEKLLELISRRAQTPMGQRRLTELQPNTSRSNLDRDLILIKEAVKLSKEDVSWSFSELADPQENIALLRIENTLLEPSVLREFASLLSQALNAKNTIRSEKDLAPTLWQIVEGLPKDLSKLAENIRKKILPSGELDDSASPELNRIRREVNIQRGRITKMLENLMRSKSDAVQDDIVTVRNNRFVIPVKSDFSGKINGVAHGTSSSGATVFIEPLDSIEANNSLQGLKAKEENEISRILYSLTDGLRENVDFIELASEAIAKLDEIKTKVEFAKSFDATVPEITDDETLDLLDARHPLLEESIRVNEPGHHPGAKAPPLLDKEGSLTDSNVTEIVPISLRLTKNKPVMIISGANAGGKTVVLKTAGLLALMAVSGLPVPASKARVPFYSSVLADIGDHQSISANLSTFSSHVSNIAGMMENLQTPALVLLDEVGTGTDPEEGSALGVAIVDELRGSGAQIVASTHYKGLKMYAANDEHVINASVEFDEKTLEPTYRLLTGLAGASSGLEIARRFGIRDDVIETARKNLDSSAQKAENYLHKLQKETKQAEDLRVALEDERETTAEKYAKLDVDFRKKEKRRRKEFESELDRTIAEFERAGKEFLKTVKNKKERKKFEKEVASGKAKLKRQKEKVKTQIAQQDPVAGTGNAASVREAAASPPKLTDEPVAVGSRVLLKSFGTKGKVEKLDGDNAEVLVGSMRMRQRIGDLQVIEEIGQDNKNRLEKLQKQAKQSSVNLESSSVNFELNLIGKTTMDVETEVDKFLDESYVSKLKEVRIIHGFGTGALKNSVHQFLKGHPHVSSFGFAPQNQGGNGATLVQLKQ